MKSKIIIGQRIKTLREKANTSQEAFADLAGIDRTYISSIERGKRNPSIDVLLNICAALNISISELLKNIEDEL